MTDDAALEAVLAAAREARARSAPKDALNILAQARTRFGDHDRILFALATVFSDLGMQDGAVTLYRTLEKRRPQDTVVLNNLAGALDGCGRNHEAATVIETALLLAPQDPALWLTKALLAHHGGDVDGAEKALRHALALDSGFGAAWLNLAEVLADKGDMEACLACQTQAQEKLGPLPLLRFNTSQTLFKLGRLAEAWPLYEARFESAPGQPPRSRPRPSSLPRWDGRNTEGTVLVWMEQGVGEEILYAGLLEEARQRAPHIMVECAPRLVPLFTRSFPAIAFRPRPDVPDESADARAFVAHIPAASLGGLLRTRKDAFCAHQGYLKVDETLRQTLKARTEALGHGPLIGLSWRSTVRRFGDPKSILSSALAEALRSKKARFLSLQYGDTASDIAQMKAAGLDVHTDAAINPLENLDAFAAQVAACDSILTVSNTTAHMAGALNIPAQVLVPAGTAAPHHWFYGQQESLWYPSLRLFWQKQPGIWADTLAAAAQALS